ncbi:MAG: hypothetical protein IT426_04330 [Pirellulales bacterium]|nr:hypothetical protein [Pirellulales bacterium]
MIKPIGKRIQQGFYALAIAAIIVVAAETGTRLEDWLYFGEDFWANPTFDGNMLVRDTNGGHGKPHGRYKRWKLNSFGFRGPEIERDPAPDTTRILVLGASETFGVDESDNKEFPAQLGTLLRGEGKFEVVNGALPGMGISGMVSYWENWASKFRPAAVVIYPNALFYLCDPPPKRPHAVSLSTAPGPTGNPPQSRFIAQFRDTLNLPGWLKEWRLERKIADRRADKPAEWHFRSVPQERLEMFASDLELLTASIRRAGAEPILSTQAIRADTFESPANRADLRAWLVNVPQADERIALRFSQQANTKIIEFGRKRRIFVVDVAACLSGDRDAFSDLVHFRDRGAETVARAVAAGIQRKFRAAAQNRVVSQSKCSAETPKKTQFESR